jgi:hypothetical protein
MHRLVKVAHSLFIEGSHTTKNMASGAYLKILEYAENTLAFLSGESARDRMFFFNFSPRRQPRLPGAVVAEPEKEVRETGEFPGTGPQVSIL